MDRAKGRRFLHAAPYAWEIGALAAAGTIWQLLNRAKREEEETERQDQVGNAMPPPMRTQA